MQQTNIVPKTSLDSEEPGYFFASNSPWARKGAVSRRLAPFCFTRELVKHEAAAMFGVIASILKRVVWELGWGILALGYGGA